jgi:hypothetical protein
MTFPACPRDRHDLPAVFTPGTHNRRAGAVFINGPPRLLASGYPGPTPTPDHAYTQAFDSDDVYVCLRIS